MLRIDIARHLKSSLYGRGIMDSELLLKFFGYLPDYLSALSHTLLRIFAQPLSKDLYLKSSSHENLFFNMQSLRL